MVNADSLLRMAITAEHDIFVVRQRGREVAAAIGMDHQDQVRVATALSEVGRQLLNVDGGPPVPFEGRIEPLPALAIVLVPQGVFGSDGIEAAARLMDGVETSGDEIVLTRRLPGIVGPERIASARAELE